MKPTDATPTWTGVLPMLLSEPENVLYQAELRHMAQVADQHVADRKVMQELAPKWAADFTVEQLGKYLPPESLPSVVPLHMHSRDEFDAVEVDPITDDEHGLCTCDEEDPNIAMWSVFLHCKEGGRECTADFTTKAEAEAYAAFLEVWLGDHLKYRHYTTA